MINGKRVAVFGARADRSGLANQTQEFCEHMKPDSILVVDISEYTNKPFDENVYQGATTHRGFPSDTFIDLWLTQERPDVIFCFEIPYNHYLFQTCKLRGIKTILQYNYEFLDYLNRPELPYPDVLLAPSQWHLEDISGRFGSLAKVVYLPVPVNRNKLAVRKIESAKRFIHVAGFKLFEDRNGTDILMKAIPNVFSKDVHFIIYCQENMNIELPSPNCNIRVMNHENYWDLYREGDVLLLPRRYGGLCLQLNEAMAVGMVPVMMEIEPQSKFLHPQSLLFPSGSKKIYTRTELDCFDLDPIHLAHRIDFLASQDISELSEFSKNYAESISWENLLPHYKNLV